MLKRTACLTVAGFMLLSVTLFDPGQISRWIARLIGWQPLQEQNVEQSDLSVRSAVQTISADSLHRHLQQFTAHPSRVTGYEGA